MYICTLTYSHIYVCICIVKTNKNCIYESKNHQTSLLKNIQAHHQCHRFSTHPKHRTPRGTTRADLSPSTARWPDRRACRRLRCCRDCWRSLAALSCNDLSKNGKSPWVTGKSMVNIWLIYGYLWLI